MTLCRAHAWGHTGRAPRPLAAREKGCPRAPSGRQERQRHSAFQHADRTASSPVRASGEAQLHAPRCAAAALAETGEPKPGAECWGRDWAAKAARGHLGPSAHSHHPGASGGEEGHQCPAGRGQRGQRQAGPFSASTSPQRPAPLRQASAGQRLSHSRDADNTYTHTPVHTHTPSHQRRFSPTHPCTHILTHSCTHKRS